MEGEGERKGVGNSDPYQFSFDSGTSEDRGPGNTIKGSFREIDEHDPSSFFDASPDNGSAASGDTGTASIGPEPATEPAPSGDTGKRRRGRPKGSGNTKEAQALHLGGFEDAVFAIHLALAGIAKCPELELDENEAKKVTLALDKLAGHYDVQPSPAAKVWMNFAGAMVAVYGPRVIAIKVRIDNERQKEAASRPRVVTPLR